jgi:hypothetical protein
MMMNVYQNFACRALILMIFENWRLPLAKDLTLLRSDLQNFRATFEKLSSTDYIGQLLDRARALSETPKRLLESKERAWESICVTNIVPKEASVARAQLLSLAADFKNLVIPPLEAAHRMAGVPKRDAKRIKTKLEKALKEMDRIDMNIARFLTDEVKQLSSAMNGLPVQTTDAPGEPRPRKGERGRVLAIIMALLAIVPTILLVRSNREIQRRDLYEKRQPLKGDFLNRHGEIGRRGRSLLSTVPVSRTLESTNNLAKAIDIFTGGLTYHGAPPESAQLSWSGLLTQIQTLYGLTNEVEKAQEAIDQLEKLFKGPLPIDSIMFENQMRTLEHFIDSNQLKAPTTQ